MAQDGVGRGHVEVEVRHHVLDCELRGQEVLALPARLGHAAFARTREVGLGDGAEIGDRVLDARLEVGEGLLVVFERRRFLARDARHAELGGVTGNLHLANEVELVGCEARVEHDLDVELLGVRVGRGAVEHGAQVLEHLGELRNGDVVEHVGHCASKPAARRCDFLENP